MYHDSMLTVASEVAALKRMCEEVVARLEDLERLHQRGDDMNDYEHGAIDHATSTNANTMRHHLEAAAAYARDWNQAVSYVLEARS